MDKDKMRSLLNESDRLIDELDEVNGLIRSELEAPDVVVVPAGGDLQAALNAGGPIELELTAGYAGQYRMPVPGTRLTGHGNNHISADGAPVFDIPPGARDVRLTGVELDVDRSEIVVLVGRNTTDQTPENMPRDVILTELNIHGHRGKRGIEFNASGQVLGCHVSDLYDPERIENQALWIANTVGGVRVEDCHLEGASQSLMIGGDTDRMPGGPVRGVIIRNCFFTKPIDTWRPIGIPVKTLLELKDGVEVIVEGCTLTNCWRAAQDGYAIVLTPRRGGIVEAKLRNLTVSNVGAIANITGFDDPFPDLQRTRVTFEGGTYATNCKELGGRGCFALITNGPQEVRILNLQCENDGSAFILIGDGDPIELLEVRGCTFRYGTYGIFINGHPDGDNSLGLVKTMIVEGNTISGAKAAFKARWPNNTYV